MLPAHSRVRTPADHALLARSGRRARCGPLVVHSLSTGSLSTAESTGARVGFVVGRKVGKAVVRNTVRRRLREQARRRLPDLPPDTLLLVRALPDAAGASSAMLGEALDTALRRVLRGGPAADSARGRGTADERRRF